MGKFVRGDVVIVPFPFDSFIRPNKIFTADKNIILSTAGHLCENKIHITINAIINIIVPSPSSVR